MVGPKRRKENLAKEFREALGNVDRSGWKRFASAIGALVLGFLLAIYSNIYAQQGRITATALCASLALLLAGYVALTAVPYLARRSSMEWLKITIDYNLTREGIAFIVVVFLLAIAALNTGNNLLYLVVASLLAALLMSGILSHAVLGGLGFEILMPEHVFARRPVSALIQLENQKKRMPSFSITLSGNRTVSRPRKGNPKTGPGGNVTGEDRPILSQPLYFSFLPGARTISRSVVLEFPQRGLYRERSFAISTRFPFGFLEKRLLLETSRELWVYPAVEPADDFYELLPQLSGEMEAYQRGRGHDLYSIREMLSTDSARHVDWKASARTGSLKVREFAREDERRIQIILDPRIGPFSKLAVQHFETGIEFCACLAWHFYELNTHLQFLCGDFQTSTAPAGDIIYDILRYLAAVQPSADTPSAPLATAAENTFQIILTAAPQGSIPTTVWSRSYIIFFESLRQNLSSPVSGGGNVASFSQPAKSAVVPEVRT